MRLSRGQQNTKLLVEKRLGYAMPEHLIASFFGKTDRGIDPELSQSDSVEFAYIMAAFRGIAIDTAMWASDFRKGLLWPSDFADSDAPTKTLALRVYRQAFNLPDGYLPQPAKVVWG